MFLNAFKSNRSLLEVRTVHLNYSLSFATVATGDVVAFATGAVLDTAGGVVAVGTV